MVFLSDDKIHDMQQVSAFEMHMFEPKFIMTLSIGKDGLMVQVINSDLNFAMLNG